MMSAQSLGLARVVLGVPFEASERKGTTGANAYRLYESRPSTRFRRYRNLDSGRDYDNRVQSAIPLAPRNFNLERVRRVF